MLNASADRRVFVPGHRPAAKRSSEGAPSQTSSTHGARLASGLRGVWGSEGQAQFWCRLKRIQADVQLVGYYSLGTEGSARLGVTGVATCKSPLCPLCAPKWARTRAEEITTAIDHWGAKRVLFGTLTMRHHKGMPLALQHRLLTRAFGHLWSGRAGQEHAHAWGGRPEAIRAHDRTWSNEHGWHPHLHVLFFRQSEAQTVGELESALTARWPEALGCALRAMKRGVCKALGAQRCPCPECRSYRENASPKRMAARKRKRPGFGGECSKARRCRCEDCTRIRIKRMFGRKLCPKKEPLEDSLHRLTDLLRPFSEANISPSKARGVKLETVRAEDRAPTYLAKLGLELAFNDAKHVKIVKDDRGREIAHYPHWGVAHLATRHGDPLRMPARRAWSELYRATKGTQTITFSDRVALGLGPDPYAEDQEPPEQSPEEFQRLLGQIAGDRWDTLRRAQGHGLLVTIGDAFDLKLLEELPFVEPPIGFHGLPESRGPPPAPYHPPSPIDRASREAAAESRGRAVVRPSFERAPLEVITWEPLRPRVQLSWSADDLLERLQARMQLGLPFSF